VRIDFLSSDLVEDKLNTDSACIPHVAVFVLEARFGMGVFDESLLYSTVLYQLFGHVQGGSKTELGGLNVGH
jgi:hypothetical protein